MPKKGADIYTKNHVRMIKLMQNDNFNTFIATSRKDLSVNEDIAEYMTATKIVGMTSTELSTLLDTESRLYSDLLKKLTPSEWCYFDEHIPPFFDEHKLGNEWFEYILKMIYLGIYDAPHMTFKLTANKEEKILTISFRRNTTLEEVLSWKQTIEDLQLDVFGPRIKQGNYSPSYIKRTAAWLRYMDLKETNEMDSLTMKPYKLTNEDIGAKLFDSEDPEFLKKQIRKIKHFGRNFE
jgi:hypothetical protein